MCLLIGILLSFHCVCDSPMHKQLSYLRYLKSFGSNANLPQLLTVARERERETKTALSPYLTFSASAPASASATSSSSLAHANAAA